jgi:hypothetical protein
MNTIRTNAFCIAGIILLICCTHFEGISRGSSAAAEEVPPWFELISQWDLGSNIIIVQEGASIQDAVDASEAGDIILVEPGIYREALQIAQSDIQIIGLPGPYDESVILENPGSGGKAIERIEGSQNAQVFNIQFLGFTGPGVIIHPLGSARLSQSGHELKMSREEIGDGIAHYEFEIDLGDGEFDRVRIHRVVRERRPFEPVRTRGDVFMVHAAIQDFDDIYLRVGAEKINEQTSSPFYLAEEKIDVWGIDLAWTLVPLETSDFSFMKGWGMERDMTHTLAGVSFARLIRGLTGQGYDRLNLLGYCCTANLVYAAAGKETQTDPVLCDLKGIIPVEGYMKYEPGNENEQWRQNNCRTAAEMKAMMDGGTYHFEEGAGLMYMAELALRSPGESSAIPPFDQMGVTNYQAYLMTGFSPPENPDTPFWHYFGGTMEEGFLYADPSRFVRLGMNLNPHMPLQHLYEAAACGCDEEEVSIDDHLEEIRLPIFYLGAEGGIGSYGKYTTRLTSSDDISHHIVHVEGAERAVDYGHADIWMGYDADELVWKELRRWLTSH